MSKFLAAALCLAVTTFYCRAQSEAPVKKFNHYVGIQSNELLRQLLHFSDDNTEIENPYFLIYSISNVSSGWGGHVGLGYDYRKVADKNAPVGKETKVNNFFLRFGAEKKFPLGKRFEGGAAFDFTMEYLLDKTFSTTVTNLGSTIDSSTTTVSNKTTGYGFGPQLSVGFHITERLILGTESTMYINFQKLTQNVNIVNTTTDIFNNDTEITTSNSNTETDTDSFTITLPVAIFLIVKF